MSIVSKRRRAADRNVGRDFDPMAVEEPSAHRNSTGAVPVGKPVSERTYAKLKKDAETSRRPRTQAQQEDGDGNDESPPEQPNHR